jgi:hypothetical protein
MAKYLVFFPYGQKLNTFLKRSEYEYEFMYSVYGDSLEQVFAFSQNENEDYAQYGYRSMSVGDIICDLDTETHYFVTGTGFQEIPRTVSQYIDWGNHVKDIDETDKISY